MKVRVKVEKETEVIKDIKVKMTVCEWLLVKKAMRCFADDEEANDVDRHAIHRMLTAKPHYKYVDVKEGE